ncbi:MAG TPA: efflux RND transporter permease subunit [Spirochaetales bacterium]|nr:efflux RND transporter permease subunit [Spirochaetales bacterium]
MKRVITSCAGRPVAVAMGLVAIMMAGIGAAIDLPRRSLPDVSVPRVLVEATMPGMSAAAMRSLVTCPLEDALASADGLIGSSSVSRDGRTVITLDFNWGEDAARMASNVRDIIDATYPGLPEGATKPSVTADDPAASPLVTVTMAPMAGDLAFAKRMAEREGRARLRRVVGVGAVTVVGGRDRELAVAVDERKAAARGMTARDVASALAAECADVPLGSVEGGGLELVVIADGRPKTVAELEAVVAVSPAGSFRLSELARVYERDAPADSLYVLDGIETVALEVYLRPGADPVATAREVVLVAEAMAVEFMDELAIRTVGDSSTAVAASIRELAWAAVIGSIAAAVVLYAMLRDARCAVMVAVSIPICIAATLAALSLAGRSLNRMSLSGLALAVGIISDNAVVTLDALSTVGETMPRGTSRRMYPTPAEIGEAASSVVGGTFGGMVTTVAVFMPIFYLPGAIGSIFGDLAFAVVVASACGWVCAMTILPAAYRLFGTAGSGGRPPARLAASYARSLSTAMRRPSRLIICAAIAAAIGVALAATRDVSFMPRGAVSELLVTARFEPGSDAEGIRPEAISLSAILSRVDGVVSTRGWAGAEVGDLSRLADPAYGPERLSLLCALSSKADTETIAREIAAAARAALPPSASLTVAEPPDPAAAIMGLVEGSTIVVNADSVEAAKAAADAFESYLSDLAGDALASVVRSPDGQAGRVLASPDRQRIAGLGVKLAEVEAVIRTATEGVRVGNMRSDGEDTDIVVFAGGAGSADRGGSLESLRSITVEAGGSAPIHASTVATFDLAYSAAALARLDRRDAIYLTPVAAVSGRGALEAAVERAMIAYGSGARSSVHRSGGSAFGRYAEAMAWTLALVLVLLYLVIGSQFESFVAPLVIMAAIPLALAGSGPTMLIAGVGLDSGSIMGLVALFGTVVNSAILLYEACAARLAAGEAPDSAAFLGAIDRLRPVLATTMTTLVALVPLCLNPEASPQRSMAVSMIGGMAASTALTLFITPTVLAALARRRAAA